MPMRQLTTQVTIYRNLTIICRSTVFNMDYNKPDIANEFLRTLEDQFESAFKLL